MANCFLYNHEYKAQFRIECLRFRSESSILLVHNRTDLALTTEKAGAHSTFKNGANEMTVRKHGSAAYSLAEAVMGFL
jgi:hypothetical protein